MDAITTAIGRQHINQVLQNWRLTPATFAHRVSRGTWIPKEHLMYISAKVAKGIARGNARIIISAPPRHGKSELSSIYVPGWILETFPQKYVILATYGADLSVGFGRRVRDMFTDERNLELFQTKLRRDSQRVQGFLTDRGGGMYSVGLGGPITGRGAHVLLIDDYIKEIKEALSPAYRDYIWNWFVTTAFTRLEPGGSCIIIATRWHTDDLIGRVLTNLRHENWEYIELPAEAKENDILGRKVGEPLFPERYPIERLRELRETLGSVFYEALYQQSPVDATKKLADSAWIKVISEADVPQHIQMRKARIWDLAATEEGGDYTVGTRMDYDPHHDNSYILGIERDQISPETIEKRVVTCANNDGMDVKVLIEQEPGSSGLALVEHYQRNVLPGFDVEGIPTTTKKVVRAQPMLAAAEGGHLYVVVPDPKNPPRWCLEFLKEFDAFPGLYDDQIDTASAGYTKLSGKMVFSATWGRKKSSRAANSRDIKRASFNAISRGNRKVVGATFGRRKS